MNELAQDEKNLLVIIINYKVKSQCHKSCKLYQVWKKSFPFDMPQKQEIKIPLNR